MTNTNVYGEYFIPFKEGKMKFVFETTKRLCEEVEE